MTDKVARFKQTLQDDDAMLHKLRLSSVPPLPPILTQMSHIRLIPAPPSEESETNHALQQSLRTWFPNTVGHPLMLFSREGQAHETKALKCGVVLSGGPAPGGHNVIVGLLYALQSLNPAAELIGFQNGADGIVKNSYIRLTKETVAKYLNQGGFDMLGSGRAKIEKAQQFESCQRTVQYHNLDGLAIIGGDDSNTNAAMIAEYFQQNGCKTKVIGVPKTIDGDLANTHVDISFGFDTACKVYSQEIASIARDARSAGKYWFFIKMMGRSASHIVLECAQQTHPNAAIISEEVAEKQHTLAHITSYLADVIATRAAMKKDYGIVLIPEGLIEFIPEFQALIAALNRILADSVVAVVMKALKKPELKIEYILDQLTGAAKATYSALPPPIQSQLILDRDAHGNVNVSQIETERLLGEMVSVELARRKKLALTLSAAPTPSTAPTTATATTPATTGSFAASAASSSSSSVSFSSPSSSASSSSSFASKSHTAPHGHHHAPYTGSFDVRYHFCGYQGRAAYPSPFDAKYTYALGHVAAALLDAGLNGYLCALSNLAKPVESWIPKAVPITSLLNIEERHGMSKPVITKALVELHSTKFLAFKEVRDLWAVQDAFLFPGPLHFYGPDELVDATNFHIRSLL